MSLLKLYPCSSALARMGFVCGLLVGGGGVLNSSEPVKVTAAPFELLGTGSHDYEPPIPGTYVLPVIQVAAGGAVLDHTGAERSLEDLTRGAITVLSFIYTRCAAPRACPYATGVLNQLHQVAGKDPALAGRVRLLSMSFDPETDTPNRLAEYSRWARDRDLPVAWHFLTTPSRNDLEPILAAYGQAVDRRRDKGHPMGPLNHVLRVFLIDPAGRIRNIYSSDTLDQRLVLADIRTLVGESANGRKSEE